MRFSTRSKLGIILSLVTILTVVSSFMVMGISSRGSGAHAASSSGVSYKTAHGKLASNPLQLGGQQPVNAAPQKAYAAPSHFGKPNGNAVNAAAQNAPGEDRRRLPELVLRDQRGRCSLGDNLPRERHRNR